MTNKTHYAAIRGDGTLLGIVIGERVQEIKSNLRAAIAGFYGVVANEVKFLIFEERGNEWNVQLPPSYIAEHGECCDEISLVPCSVYGKP